MELTGWYRDHAHLIHHAPKNAGVIKSFISRQIARQPTYPSISASP